MSQITSVEDQNQIQNDVLQIDEKSIEVPKDDSSCKCHICKVDYNSKDALDNHMASMHLTNSYQCSECNIKFAFFTDMSKHKLEYHNYLYFKCCDCNSDFTELYDLMKHKFHVHHKIITCGSTCSVCEQNRKLNRKETGSDLEDDLESNESTDAYQCTECNLTFVQFTDMSEHKAKQHNYLYLKCCDCPGHFPDLFDLMKHKYYKHNKLLLCYSNCEICENNRELTG